MAPSAEPPASTPPAREPAPIGMGRLGQAVVGSMSWIPREQLSVDDWRTAGQRIKTLAEATQWWLGDWVEYGERRWGEKYTDAVEITGYELGTLHTIAWVARTFDPSRRRAALSWSHHKEVAGLEPAAQDGWLDRAERKRWSVLRFRSELRLTVNLEGWSTEPALPTERRTRPSGRGQELNESRLPKIHRVSFTLQRRAGTREAAQEATATLLRFAVDELGFELGTSPQFR